MEKFLNALKELNPQILEVEDHLMKDLFDKEAKSILVGFKVNNQKIIFDIFWSKDLLEVKITPKKRKIKSYYKTYEYSQAQEIITLIEVFLKKFRNNLKCGFCDEVIPLNKYQRSTYFGEDLYQCCVCGGRHIRKDNKFYYINGEEV